MLNIVQHLTTPKEHQKGVMFQKPLMANDAVLFEFAEESSSGFYNKNVSFPIDVAFFDKNKYLINIEQLDAYQMLDVRPARPYKYVIETRKGWFSENNIQEGHSMDTLLNKSLLKLGFKKTAVYDPTIEANTQDANPLFKQVNPLPTGQAIDALSNQWMYRKAAPQPYLRARRMLKDYNEVT